jgi:putative transcriptional regulator
MNDRDDWSQDPNEHLRWLQSEFDRVASEERIAGAEPHEHSATSIHRFIKRTNLFDIRQKRGLTQSSLATRTGTTRQEISAIENGRREPSVYLALAVANVLEAPIEELFCLQQPRTDADKDYWKAVIRD